MSEEKLQKDLERLRREIDHMPADQSASRDHLLDLIADIEGQISAESRKEPDQQLGGNIRAAIRQFETEHPRATAILNDIMVTLSNMGI